MSLPCAQSHRRTRCEFGHALWSQRRPLQYLHISCGCNGARLIVRFPLRPVPCNRPAVPQTYAPHAGLSPGATAINADLLKVSETLLTSFTAQSEDDILALVTEALHLPRGVTSRTPSLASHASLLLPPSKPLADVIPPLPKRWSVDSGLPGKDERYKPFADDRFKPFAPGNVSSPSSCTLDGSICGGMGVGGGKGRQDHYSIPDIASYDDLFADGQILASASPSLACWATHRMHLCYAGGWMCRA